MVTAFQRRAVFCLHLGVPWSFSKKIKNKKKTTLQANKGKLLDAHVHPQQANNIDEKSTNISRLSQSNTM